MQQRRRAEEPAPARTYRPLRQIVVYLCITYGLTLAVALALPHAGITPLIAIVFPVIAVALTVAFTVPRGQRRAVWAGVGFNPRRGRGLLIAVLGPAVIIAVSFGVAAAFGVISFPGLGPGFGLAVLNLALTIVIFAVVFLGEEIGWRGYLLFRVAELTSGRRAAVITGAFHAIFHLPLLLLTTTYQGEGKRCSTDGDGHADAGGCLVWLAAPVVGKHLAGQSRSQRLQQSGGDRRRGGGRDVAGDDGLRDHRDRRSDHDHLGAGRGLPADPPSRRLRQSRAKVPAADHQITHCRLRGRAERPTLDPTHGTSVGMHPLILRESRADS
jgi:membrane protease YdiL (CAAX protease family)